MFNEKLFIEEKITAKSFFCCFFFSFSFYFHSFFSFYFMLFLFFASARETIWTTLNSNLWTSIMFNARERKKNSPIYKLYLLPFLYKYTHTQIYIFFYICMNTQHSIENGWKAFVFFFLYSSYVGSGIWLLVQCAK